MPYTSQPYVSLALPVYQTGPVCIQLTEFYVLVHVSQQQFVPSVLVGTTTLNH